MKPLYAQFKEQLNAKGYKEFNFINEGWYRIRRI